MLADALTKLASTSVIATLHAAMHGNAILAPPVVSSAHVDESTSVPPSDSADGDDCAHIDFMLQSSVRLVKNIN